MKYIIEFLDSATQSDIDGYLNDISLDVVKLWNQFDHTVLVESANYPPHTDIVERIILDDESQVFPLEYPQLLDINRKLMFGDSDSNVPEVTFTTTDEKDWWKNYIQKFPKFDADSVTIPRRGYSVPVYILDSGITHDHPEFENCNIENVWTVTPDDYSDPHGHGTAIASVISGATCGLAASPLKIVKIFRSDRGTYLSEFLDALNTVLNHIDPGKLAVVNCSWSIPRNEFIDHKFRKMLDRGILVVAAAGNSGVAIEDVTPASMQDVLAVGSYGPDLVPSDFSNYQGTSEISYTDSSVNSGAVNVWAPGEKIWAAKKDGGLGYTAGTSMSAAIASMIVSYLFTGLVGDDGYALEEAAHKGIYLTWSKLGEKYDRITQDGPMFMGITGNVEILDLSDPKYSQAKNYMMVLPGNFKDYFGGEFSPKPAYMREKYIFYVRAGKLNYVSALHSVTNSAKEIWLNQPLPEFCRVSRTGTIVVEQPHPETTMVGDYLDIYQLKFTAVHDDDTTHMFDVEIRVVSDDLVLEDLPEDHEIRVTLLSVCEGSSVPECSGPDVTVCDNFCGAGRLCCFPNALKGEQECRCFELN